VTQKKRHLINILALKVGWLSCVVAAGRGEPWFGPAVVAGLLALHFWLNADRRTDLVLMVAVVPLGFSVDSLLAASGLLVYQAAVLPWPLAPPWILALWLLFASTLRHGMAWLGGRPVAALLFGALGGPLGYAAGSRLGAVSLPSPPWTSLAGQSVLWAAVLPLIVWLANVVEQRRLRLLGAQTPDRCGEPRCATAARPRSR
jgi:hypothetical protein